MFWTPEVYEFHIWSARRLRGACELAFMLWWAGGGAGKTRDAAAFALEYWMEAPWETAVIVCSTTKAMLRKRIWNDVCHLWHRIELRPPHAPLAYKGEMMDTDCMIRWSPNDKKHGIFGIAVADGPVEDAINDLRGIHAARVLWILDEMQGVEEAIMGVCPNHSKNPEARFWGFGNPTRMSSMLCRYAEPLGGWQSVVRGETEEWPIDEGLYQGKGACLFFDGRKSPAILDPEWGRRNPWMISKEQVDKHIAKKGMNAPEVWTDTIGWPPMQGGENTVLDPQLIEKFRCKEAAIWTSEPRNAWALDPAFAEGGDERILQFFRFGKIADEFGDRWVIELGEVCEVPLNAESKEPAEYQIVEYVRERCKSKGLRPEDGATDSSGTGRGLLSAFHKEWGQVLGVEFGGRPSELPADESGKPADEVFDRRVSELNVMVRNFASAHGLRGLSKGAEEQFCKRQMIYEGKGKWVVESKKVMKARGENSPDRADAVAIAVAFAREHDAVPGDYTQPLDSREHEKQQQDSDDMYTEDNYQVAEDWRQFQVI